MPEPGQIVLFLAGTLAVIFAAYYVTYYIGVKSSGFRQGANRNISLLDRFAVSKDKSFYVIEVCGKVYLVGMTNQSIALLDTFPAEMFEKKRTEGAEQGFYPAFTAGGRLSRSIMKRLSAFFAGRMERQNYKTGWMHKKDLQGDSFSDTLKNAHKNASNQPRTEESSGHENSSGGPEEDR